MTFFVSSGCETAPLQTTKPPLNYGEPPENGVEAKFYGTPVIATFTPTGYRPRFGWLLVERFPGDEVRSVVPAFPYSAYANYYGVVHSVYPGEIGGLALNEMQVRSTGGRE